MDVSILQKKKHKREMPNLRAKNPSLEKLALIDCHLFSKHLTRHPGTILNIR